MTRPPSVFRVLVLHFLRQFASLEATATGGEAKHAIIAVVSLLAAPGYLAAVAAARGSRATYLAKQGRLDESLWLWREEWLLFSISLVVVSVVVAINWRALVLGERDHRILGLLPVPRRTVVSAKLASLGVVVLSLHLAINTLPGLWLPVASPLGYFRAAAALEAALLAQTVFTCAAIVAAQGLVALALPARSARRASAAIQAAALLGASALFMMEGAVSRLAYHVRDESHLVNALVPVVWFRALYVALAGGADALTLTRAQVALAATVAAVVLAVPCTFLGFREKRADGVPRARAGQRWHAPLAGLLAPAEPVARATCTFVQAALTRSAGAALIARGWVLVGVALTLNGLAGIAMREQGWSAPEIPTAPLHAPAIVLPFFALVGLRLAAAFPASLDANWLFRVTEVPGSPDYAAGVRAAAVRCVVLPVLLALALPYVVLWGPWRAAAHLGLALTVALVTAEWLFFDFPKVPFTCTYLPGRANLRLTWPKYAAVFFFYCGLAPAAAARLLDNPLAYAIVLSLLLATRRLLVVLRGRRLGPALVFDEAGHAGVTQLGLEWRAAADLR